MAKETRSHVWKYFANNKEENSSRFLVQSQKQCGKILKGKFATNLKKHKISTRKNLKNVTAEKQWELTVPEREEPGTFITITRSNTTHHQPTMLL